MIKGLKKLGIKIAQSGSTIKVKGNGGKFKKSKTPIKINTGNAGTTTRFLTALATLTGNKIIINGDKRMRERPIEELVKSLNKLGAKIESTNGCPPLIIHPKKLVGGNISIKGNISSQYISALLMVSPFAEEKTTVKVVQKLYSKPYIDMTVETIKDFGIKMVNKNFSQFKANGNQQAIANKSYIIESDASSASYIGAYAALHHNISVLLKNIHSNSIQGDIKFLDYLKKMGCKIKDHKEGTIVQGPKTLKSLKVIDMNQTPDLVMTFAILAMFTKGKTRITNISNLRIKETDRICALQNEIKKLGIKVKTGKDFIEIKGNPDFTEKITKTTTINTYNDHRIAMSFAILTDMIPQLKIENPKCVTKSYPTFWEDLNKLTKHNG